MKIKKTLLGIVLTATLTACASHSPEQIQVTPLADSMLCCSDFASFPWIALNRSEDLDFHIDESSPVGKFAEGNSYFNAFALPKEAKRVSVRLSSKMLNGSVFAPKLIALDKDFNLVEFRELESFDLRAANAFTRNQYLLNLMLDAQKTPYFIVYTKANTLGTSVKVDHPAKIRAKQFGEPMPMVVDPSYTFSHFGKLSLKINAFTLNGYQDVSSLSSNSTPIDTAATTNVLNAVKQHYFDAIKSAVQENDIKKALHLLEEAKAQGVKGANEHFVEVMEQF